MMYSDKLMNGYELRQIFSQTDLIEGNDYMIADQTMFTQSGGADVATLNAIYNASDCFLTTTLGGGWELTVTEAMACRCPVIAPYHTSLVEISGHGKRMWNLYELEPFCSPFDSIIRAKCNIDEIAEMILDVYNQKVAATDTLKTKLNAAQKYVLSLDWNILGNRLAEIIYDC
jgi:glycosyltransferase involved in cell wall biosynthesis